MKLAVCSLAAALSAGGLLGLPLRAGAVLPTYPTLRAQAASGSLLANLPSGASLSSESPAINNTRQVTFRFLAPNSSQIWLGSNAIGGPVYSVDTSVDFILLGTPTINASGFLAWSQDLPTNGIYRYNPVGPVSGFFFNRPIGTQTYGSPRVNDAGQVGFRAGFGGSGQAWVSYDPPTNSTLFHALETGLDPAANISFLYTPNFNNARLIAGKVSRATFAQEEIRIYDSAGASTLVAQDADVTPGSPFQGFDNSVGFNDAGDVAFIATRTAAAGGGRGVFLRRANDPAVLTIALQGQDGIAVGSNNIEFFAPAVNNSGLVVFRAFNSSGQRAVWVGDGSTLAQVATLNSAVLLPGGGTATVFRSDGSPHFGGSPDINDAGDVVFNAQLNGGVSAAIVVAEAVAPPPPTGACCAGVTCSVLAPGACTGPNRSFKGAGSVCNAPGNSTTPCCRADFNQDGSRAPGDIFAFLNAYFSTVPGESALTDADASGQREPADIFAFLNLYFAGGC